MMYQAHRECDAPSSRGRLGSRPCSSKVNVHDDAGPSGGRVSAVHSDIIVLPLLDVFQAAISGLAKRMTAIDVSAINIGSMPLTSRTAMTDQSCVSCPQLSSGNEGLPATCEKCCTCQKPLTKGHVLRAVPCWLIDLDQYCCPVPIGLLNLQLQLTQVLTVEGTSLRSFPCSRDLSSLTVWPLVNSVSILEQ